MSTSGVIKTHSFDVPLLTKRLDEIDLVYDSNFCTDTIKTTIHTAEFFSSSHNALIVNYDGVVDYLGKNGVIFDFSIDITDEDTGSEICASRLDLDTLEMVITSVPPNDWQRLSLTDAEDYLKKGILQKKLSELKKHQMSFDEHIDLLYSTDLVAILERFPVDGDEVKKVNFLAIARIEFSKHGNIDRLLASKHFGARRAALSLLSNI